MICSNRIEQTIRERNIKNKMLAERIGVSSSMITRYLNGDSEMSATTLCKIATVLNVSVDYLCGIEGSGTISTVGLSNEQVEIVNKLVSALKNQNMTIKKDSTSERFELIGRIVAELIK